MVFGTKLKQVSLNPVAFIGVTKREFFERYEEILKGQTQSAWEYVRDNRPRKPKED